MVPPPQGSDQDLRHGPPMGGRPPMDDFDRWVVLKKHRRSFIGPKFFISLRLSYRSQVNSILKMIEY